MSQPLLWDVPQADQQAFPSSLDRWLAARIQHSIEPAAVRLVLWDGHTSYRNQKTPVGDLILRDRSTLRRLAVDPEYYFGEGYMSGRLAVRGPLERVVESLSRLPAKTPGWLHRVLSRMALPNSIGAARRNVRAHYDLGNEFYQLWLDSEMLYTCAYFDRPEVSLERAQLRKLDVVCRKLGLRPGETVVEAGCGWGALARHMARHYGVRVKAFNISAEQLAYARDRAVRDGLADRIEFIDDDYRNVAGVCDAFVSIGMLEHVGARHFGSLASVLRRVVKRDGGRGLLHFIGRDTPRPLNAWIRRRIFPGAYPPTIAEVATRVLAPAHLSVIDIENLRLHYERTLAHWSDRFAANQDRIQAHYGSEFTRSWQLYLAGSQAAFASGWMQLFQIVFAPQGSAPPWWTRPGVRAPEAGDDPL